MTVDWLPSLSALQRGAPGEAMHHLIEVWRQIPDPHLADLVDQLSWIACPARPWSGTRAEVHERFLAVATAQDEAELPTLLAVLPNGTKRELRERMEALSGWPRDPRLAKGLVDLIFRPPPQNDLVFWGKVWKVLALQRDPRALDVLEVCTFAEVIRKDTQVNWFRLRRAKELPKWRAQWDQRVLTQDLAELTAEVESLVTRHQESQSQREELLQRICADPSDDDARRVYADVLQSLGDPRGELIALQLLASPSLAQKQRISALVDEYRAVWLGPLRRVITKKSVAFRRGFLAEAKIKSGERAPGELNLAHDWRWSTVERLVLSGSVLEPELFASAPLNALSELEGIRSLDTLLRIARWGRAGQLRRIALSDWTSGTGWVNQTLSVPAQRRLRDCRLGPERIDVVPEAVSVVNTLLPHLVRRPQVVVVSASRWREGWRPRLQAVPQLLRTIQRWPEHRFEIRVSHDTGKVASLLGERAPSGGWLLDLALDPRAPKKQAQAVQRSLGKLLHSV